MDTVTHLLISLVLLLLVLLHILIILLLLQKPDIALCMVHPLPLYQFIVSFYLEIVMCIVIEDKEENGNLELLKLLRDQRRGFELEVALRILESRHQLVLIAQIWVKWRYEVIRHLHSLTLAGL
jgi:hypothetical protein